MRKINRKIHLWLSIPAGMVISLLCFTGCIMVFDGGAHRDKESFFHSVMQLHRWLLMGDKPLGKLIVGISTVSFILILMSGIIGWWPKGKQWSAFFRLRAKGKVYRAMANWHRVAGFTFALVLLLLCFTGLMWSFEGYRSAIASLFGVEQAAGEAGAKAMKGFMRGVIYPLHSGQWGGVITQVITFIAAFVGGCLPLTGYYLWWKKRKF